MEKQKESLLNWSSSEEIIISPEGKVNISFSEDCPLEVALNSFSINIQLTPSYHNFFEITYIYKGKGTLYVENKKYNVSRGDIFIIGDTIFHRLETDHEVVLEAISLYFRPDFVYSVGQNSLDFEYLRPFFDHSAEFKSKIDARDFSSNYVLDLLEKIYEEKFKQKEFFQLAIKNYLTQILLIIIRYYRKFSTDLLIYTKRRYNLERLSNVFSFLQKNYNARITLNAIAKIACMSIPNFCKLFKKVTGSSLTDYISRLRIDRAKELLLKGELNITEIAFKVGFNNHSYFDHIFRRFTKRSPKEYRYKSASK